MMKSFFIKKEVILSAGAFNSPKILILSGIGPRSVLENLGITPVNILEGVGKNLQDHLEVSMYYKCNNRQVTQSFTLLAIPQMIKYFFQYIFSHKGPMTSIPISTGGFICSTYSPSKPDIQFTFNACPVIDNGRVMIYETGFSVKVALLYPQIRGSVTLTSTNDLLIDFNQSTYAHDIECLREGVKVVRKIIAGESFQKINCEEMKPGHDIVNDDMLDDYIKQNIYPDLHPAGTCKMGNGQDAVVDHELKVHGVTQLRVIDASIMPTLVGGNTNAPTIMIAEKGADMIMSQIDFSSKL